MQAMSGSSALLTGLSHKPRHRPKRKATDPFFTLAAVAENDAPNVMSNNTPDEPSGNRLDSASIAADVGYTIAIRHSISVH